MFSMRMFMCKYFQHDQPNWAAGRLQAMHSLGLQAPWVDLAKRFFTSKVAQLLEETLKQSEGCGMKMKRWYRVIETKYTRA